ncbi:MAG: ATP-binding protein [Lentisphaerae bacterium]|nr:ATP-binding protein [Lentisphaerota bacterium]
MTTIQKLQSLKLAGMAKCIETRNDYALEKQLSYMDFIELLIEDELANRQSNSYRKRFVQSKLSEEKSIQTYDFSYQPKLDKKLLLDLASCRFIHDKQNIIFMGNPGVGKTHLANALGLEILRQGMKAQFLHATELIDLLLVARGNGSYSSIMKKLLELDCLIIDELGFKSMPKSSVDEFFEIIRRRYEHKSIIITSNRNFEEWPDIFGDAVLAGAIVDRIVHHSVVIRITGNSYRTKHLISNKNSLNKGGVSS